MVESSTSAKTPDEAIASFTEAELEILGKFFIESVHQLLGVNKDLINRELHPQGSNEILTRFASDKNQRTIVFSKIEKPDSNEEEVKSVDPQDKKEAATSIKLYISDKVEYQGTTAQAVAFLKREPYKLLYLKDKLNMEVGKMPSVTPGNDATPGGDPSALDQEDVDLSSQLQVINLGYIGQDSNIFELAATYVDFSILPLFQDYKSKSVGAGSQGADVSSGSAAGLDNILKGLSSLKMNLAQCRQNQDIPNVDFPIEPIIKARIESARERKQICNINEFDDIAQDKYFLNSLNNYVNNWYRDIRKVTGLDHAIESGNALQEINFWQQMEQRLTTIKEKQGSEEVLMTLNILSQAKRYMTVMTFQHDTDIDPKLKTAKDYNKLLKEIPILSLYDAMTLQQIDSSIKGIFAQLKKMKYMGNYPLERALDLSESIARDFDAQLKKVISSIQIMQMEYREFSKINTQEIMEVQKTWSACIDDLKQSVQGKMNPNTSAKTRSEIEHRIDIIKDDPVCKKLKDISLFRNEHEKLEQVITQTFSKQEAASDKARQGKKNQSLIDIQEAYEHFCKSVNILDVTKEGQQAWDNAKKAYEIEINKIEAQLSQLLRNNLSKAQNASEMLQVFTDFNKLLQRPKIGSTVKQYQSQLLQSTQKDIDKLKNKLFTQDKMDKTLNKVRDMPDIVHKVVWLNNLNQKIRLFQDKLATILGPHWQDEQEGIEVKKTCDQVLKRLQFNQTELFQTWFKQFQDLNQENEKLKPIFQIQPKGNKYQMVLNFDENLFRLKKEKINLERAIERFDLGFKMNIQAKFKSDAFDKLYPIAMSLQQSLRTFQVTNSKITEEFEMLINEKKNDAQNALLSGLENNWKTETVAKNFANRLLPKVIAFEDIVNEAQQKTEYINTLLQEMTDCELVKDNFASRLGKIQKVVDDFNLDDMSNLNYWVAGLNDKIEKILVRRLEQLLQAWIDEFVNFETKGGTLIQSKMVLDIKIQNLAIIMEPTMSEARAYWYKELHKQVEVICGLEKVESKKFQNEARKDNTYMNLLNKMDEKCSIKTCYSKLEQIFNEADSYYETWRSYQSLWDIEQSHVYDLLGDNIDRWNQMLNEIRQGRKTFDTSEDFKCFGGIEISYGTVQGKVNNKYDQIHKEILNKFGSTLAEQMKAYKDKVQNGRRQLEQLSLEESEDVTLFVTEIQEMKRIVPQWEVQLDRCKAGQKLLSQQRFIYPPDWLWIDVIEGEWASFKQILHRRSTTMDEQIPSLQKKILEEESQVDRKIKEIEIEWRDQRPKEASDRPQEASSAMKKAINSLTILGQKIKQTIQELIRVCKAKELLDMELGDPHYLDNLTEDHTNLLQVWQKIQEIWSVIDQIEQTPFQVYVNKTVKEALEALSNQMREFPTRMRSYQIYEVYTNHLKNYKKFNEMLMDLRNDAMKPKHWKELLGKLQISIKFQDILLGDLWSADLLGKQKAVQDVLTQARGEAILENFINMIKETWSTHELELVNYQTKCKLIKGWDDLFQLCEDHMNNINSMKMSPYYKVFEKDIEPWSKTLEQIRITFDYWIDVQRRYVYLEGIFFGSADIKSMLSNEFTRFKQIDADFTKLMKQVTKTPIVLEVMKIPNLEKMLQSFTQSLQMIQKALGEYLEKQRSNFARFYFVGDEDLLEIIGNSKMIKNVQRHFPKMFAGITTLNYDHDGDHLIGMNSREGESVPFAKPVIISEDPTIYKWLTKTEEAMQVALAVLLEKSVKELEILDRVTQQEEFNQWIIHFPAQIDILALQVSWSNRIEEAFAAKGQHLKFVEQSIGSTLEMLAERVLTDLQSDIRKKYEQLITDLVHQRVVSIQMLDERVTDKNQFSWLYHMRFYFNSRVQNPLEKLLIKMANSDFFYGFEYLGVGEKLVQTPLTDRCYLTLTQALHWRMGGSPFGPAGTGKTESVKALGAQLGRFVLVFNCDETFDGNAMGRIFVGLCQVGAWGCFDEFNRLEERMLSAVSQQILTIQSGLREQTKKMELMGREIKLNLQMGIFITMNPDYAGRSQLPDNLKQLFRAMAMTNPNKDMIARVMLYSQGFKTADGLSGKIVSLFGLCHSQLSSQSHYDFGLRALKSVLVSAGNLKRKEKALVTDASQINEDWEARILIKSLCDTLVPKLIADDIPLLSSLLTGVFPGSSIIQQREGELKNNLMKHVTKYNLVASNQFIEKCMQLYQIQNLCHGVMMVGPTGVGKSAAWKLLLDCMERVDKIPGVSYIVDPKAISKDDLYGKLDSTTAEWTDGVFTGILRRIIDNARGEAHKRHWIIFDGDVDPEWAENLNSVLDDNKLLTLPSGERLQIPANVRIMFEVETLKYATLATVSRCGMVWFSNETVTSQMMYHHYLCRLQQDVYDSIGEDTDQKQEESKAEGGQNQIRQLSEETIKMRTIRKQCVNAIRPLFEGDDDDCFVTKSLELAATQPHVMEFTRMRCLEALFALIRKGIQNILDYNENHADFPLELGQIENFMKKWTIFATVWGIGGSMNLATRTDFSNQICNFTAVETPPRGPSVALIDYEIRLEDQKWHLWKESVPVIDIDPKKVTDADVVITTVDTNRHQEVLCSWLSEKRPFLLCGPPGSGKTMTLMATLKKLTDMEMVFINFSSSTTCELITKTFDHYCDVKKTNSGLLMTPRQAGKWLVVFCDEINLPETDKYGTIPVITFLRQMTEQNGFYRQSDKQWVTLERIMFVGACNPPTDAGRSLLSDRFLRHAPLIFVDFPGPESLKQIYGTFNRAMLKRTPQLKSCADPLTEAMVEFYSRSQQHFTADMQAHYIYSPRELTRWKYAINEALDSCEEPEDLVRLYVHEGLRLFEDRLVYAAEKVWCNETIDEVAKRWFPSMDSNKALVRPIYFTNYLNKNYVSVGAEELKDYIEARLKQFYEEELNVPLVVFDSVLDHILRIDRVLRQPLGHLLLVGASGVGKTTLTRFVSWMQDLALFQIKAGRNYSVFDFDEDLRKVMRQAGVDKRKTCFVFDESNVLGAAFLERMNALLAGGEVPGLFDGEEYTKLIAACKEEGRKSNKMLDSEEEIYKQFVKDVQRNLHVVFTMNPSNPDFSNRTASSPALFNRCVIDWFGDWSDDGLLQVAQEFTKYLDVPSSSFTKSVDMPDNSIQDGDKKNRIDPKTAVLSKCIVDIHTSVRDLNIKLMKSAKKFNYITPRDFLDFIGHFIHLNQEKKTELEELQGHLNIGISKLKNTERSVSELGEKLKQYSKQLEQKQTQVNSKMSSLTIESTKVSEQQKIAEKTKKVLEEQTENIAARKAIAEKDLAGAEPALIAAQESVKGVTKDNINELKNYSQPPPKVRLALEPVIALIKNLKVKPEWKDVLAEVKKDTFKQTVLDFNKDNITAKCKEFIQKTYLDDPAYDVDAIFKASRAAGPLANWVKSIIMYADIYLKIEPLRNEVKELEEQKNINQREYEQILEDLTRLQKNLDAMQTEYQQLVQELTKLKEEQQTVSKKVEKSGRLFLNLKSELDRWVESSKNFDERMANLIGDVLISSAVLTYIGFFDHYQRKNLVVDWRISVADINMKTTLALSMTEFLSKPQERILWQHEELPNDDLCIENAIIMKRYNRYPLIIDPSDQALKYIMNHYKKDKIQKTSFADNEFLSRISEGLQYGVPILVQDVEKIEPVMNSVLNKEVQKVGGRLVMQLGDKEIACNGVLTMFLLTRNQNAIFTPDLCSRVTFVNFTVTPSSLMSQCLNIYLKNERPDIDKRRTDLLKLQGESKEKLRMSEDQLLDALNNAKGEILDNDELIQTLESLKAEAKHIATEMAKTDETLAEIEQVSNEYTSLATMTTRVFFTLDSLSQIHYLYQYSLGHFMDIVYSVLKSNPAIQAIPLTDPQKRLRVITQQLFLQFNQTVNQGLLLQHSMLFSMRLAQIRLGEDESANQLFDLFLRSATILEPKKLGTWLLDGRLTKMQLCGIEELSHTPHFSNLVDSMQNNEAQWLSFLDHPMSELHVPEPWHGGDDVSTRNPIARVLKKLMIIKVLRPDRLIYSVSQFIQSVLGEEVETQTPIDLLQFVNVNVNAKSPLLMVSAPGYDASYKIELLAKQANKKYTSVAIGSPEAFGLVDQAIRNASKSGSWVLLKNVHLAPQWLTELEKKIYSMQLDPNFRLFLTMENNPKVPATLIRASHVLIFEPPSGIKAALMRSYTNTITQQRTDKEPIERKRLHFIVSWFNAVVQERLRYTPIGWSKVYEFNESDQRCTLDCIDEWIDSMGTNRTNIDPEKIPWDALKTLISQSVFGGKIDNEFDQKILMSLVEKFFSPEIYNDGFTLFDPPVGTDEQSLTVPDAKSHKDYVNFIKNIHLTETPAWSGLPNNVEKIVRERAANSLVTNIKIIQGTGDDLDTGASDAKDESKSAWLIQLQSKCEAMVNLLPGQLELLKRTEQLIKNPLFRFLEREVTVASNLLDTVRKDLLMLIEMCQGERKSTQFLKQLAEELHADLIPNKWRKYVVPNISATIWIKDFVTRVEQLKKLSAQGDFGQSGLWYGGLLYPEAYLTATRQAVAQNNNWSLEELELQFEINLTEKQIQENKQGFILTGFTMQGAEYKTDEERFGLTEKLQANLPNVNFKWVHKKQRQEELAKQGITEDATQQIQIPVYLNTMRRVLITPVKINTHGIPQYVWYQRGVALFAWSQQ